MQGPPTCCSPTPGPPHRPARGTTVGNPVSQDLLLTSLMKGPRHLPEKRKSDPEPRLSRSPPPGASAQQGSAGLSLPGCCALALRLQDQVVYCGGRLHEGGGATNHSC